MPAAAAAGRVREALAAASDAFTAAGVDTPRLDAEVLLAEATGRDRTTLAADPEAAVDAQSARRFGEMVRRRIRREPVAYILGRKGFRNIELEVDPRVLIPRPESELLIDIALELEPASVLDVGTGSGAIALAVADELPGCDVVGTDTSNEALELARDNADRLGLADRVTFESGTVPPEHRFDLVLANLPYVREGDLAGLEPEIREYEPRQAVVAGAEGLESIAVVAVAAYGALTERGALAFEVGAGQAGAVAELLVDLGFMQVEGRQDLAGIPRVVLGRMSI